MFPQGDNERLLVQYLLGDLSEEKQVEVEDRAFGDVQYMAELETTETKLIDAYVKGELARSESQAFERRFLTSPNRQSKVEFAKAFAMVGLEWKAKTGVKRSWREILTEAPSVFPSNALLRVDDLEWKSTPFEGIEAKILSYDAVTGAMLSLLRMRAGANYPPHRHADCERMYVLEGDIDFGDHVLYAGEYGEAEGESLHAAATTRNGCMVLIQSNAADQVLT